MPAIVGAVNVITVSGVFNIGDAGIISPTTYSKTYAGGGSFNTGRRLNVTNAPSVINVYGSTAYDQIPVGPPYHTTVEEADET